MPSPILFDLLAQLAYLLIQFGLVLIYPLRLPSMWEIAVKRSPHINDGVASLQVFASWRPAGTPCLAGG